MANNGNLPSKESNNATGNYFNNYFTTQYSTSPDINDAITGYFQKVTGDADAGKTLAATVIYTALSNGIEPMSLIDEFRKLKTGKKVEIKTPIDSTNVVGTYTTYDEVVAHKNEYPIGKLFYVGSTNSFYRSFAKSIPVEQPIVVQTTFENPGFFNEQITFDDSFTANVGDYIYQPATGANATVVSEPTVGNTTVTVIYNSNEMFTDEGNIQIEGVDANVYLTNTELTFNYPIPPTQEFINPENVVNPDLYITKTIIDQTIQIQQVTGYKADRIVTGPGQYDYNYYEVTTKQDTDELTPYLTVLLNTNRVGTSLLGLSNSPKINKYIQRAILP
jgi:hypothetical protein